MNFLRCAGWLAAAVFLGLVARFWHPVFGFTKFLQLDAPNASIAVDAFRTYPVYVYRNTGPYDGMIYAQIAEDPTLRDPQLSRAIDNLAYRGRRILAPAIAWVLAGGRPGVVTQIYPLVNVIAWLALGALFWRGLPVNDARGFVGWAGVLFSAGAIGCVRLALTDLIGATLLFAAVLSAERKRGRSAVALAALSGLTRETLLLGVGGLWDNFKPTAKNLLRAVLAALPLALWMLYLRHLAAKGDAGWANFTWPVAGLAGKWAESIRALSAQGDVLLAVTTLLAVVGLTTQWIWLIWNWEPSNRWWRMGAPFALVLVLLGKAVWEGFPGAAFRTLLPLTLAFNLLAVRKRSPWIWLLIGNLTVLSGLLTLRDVPTDPNEIGAAHAHGQAVVARTGAGWYGTERTSRHQWTWTSGAPSVLDFQSWPAHSSSISCTAEVRSLAPGSISIHEGARLLWSGPVGARRSPIKFSVEVREGQGQIVFTTDAPTILEGPGADARRLAFALYDLKVSIPDVAAGIR